jgi:hypothetical protein
MSGAVPPLPQYAFMAWFSVAKGIGITFTFRRCALECDADKGRDFKTHWEDGYCSASLLNNFLMVIS